MNIYSKDRWILYYILILVKNESARSSMKFAISIDQRTWPHPPTFFQPPIKKKYIKRWSIIFTSLKPTNHWPSIKIRSKYFTEPPKLPVGNRRLLIALLWCKQTIKWSDMGARPGYGGSTGSFGGRRSKIVVHRNRAVSSAIEICEISGDFLGI